MCVVRDVPSGPTRATAEQRVHVLGTTNALEREHEEIRRRTRVIRIPAAPTINVKNVMGTTRAAFLRYTIS